MANINRDDIPDFGLNTFTVDAVKRIVTNIVTLDKIKEESGHKSEVVVISLVDHTTKLKISHITNSVVAGKESDIIIRKAVLVKPMKKRISPRAIATHRIRTKRFSLQRNKLIDSSTKRRTAGSTDIIKKRVPALIKLLIDSIDQHGSITLTLGRLVNMVDLDFLANPLFGKRVDNMIGNITFFALVILRRFEIYFGKRHIFLSFHVFATKGS